MNEHTELQLTKMALYAAMLTIGLDTRPSLAAHVEESKERHICLSHCTNDDGEPNGHVFLHISLDGLSREEPEYEEILLSSVAACFPAWSYNHTDGDALAFTAENQALVYRGER